MMWKEILKDDTTHGLHVTKFYMFLKRWLADTHTKQFRRTYLLFDELVDDYEKRVITHSLERLLVQPHADPGRETFPGITINKLDKHEIDLEFNDAEHLKKRRAWIKDSSETTSQARRKRRGAYGYVPWWEKEPPYDTQIQSAWKTISFRIKKSQNYHWRWGTSTHV